MKFRSAIAVLVAASFSLCAMAQETTKTETTAASGSASAPAAGMVPLKLKLPKPLFVGTPKNINVENLEPATGKERPAFMVPDGVENLALKKDVTASDSEPTIGELEMITDGDKEAADGSYVEFGSGTQYVQIDLGKPSEIFAILAWHYHQQARVYHDVVVRIADDKDFITNVQTVYNNDSDNSSKLGVGKDRPYVETYEGRLIDCKGAKGRFVRLYSKGNTANDMNHYIEVEVYGKPVK